MASGYSVVISAVDRVSTTIDKVNKKFVSMSAPITRLNASFKKFGDVSGLKAVYGGVEKLGGGMVRLARSAATVVAPLGAITSAASLAGVIALTERFGDFGSQLGFTAANIGISAQSLHGLEGAARLAGASGASAASGMLNLSQAITDAAGGRNTEALGYFRQLGISIRDATGHLRTAEQVLPEVADGIARITNPALQRRVAGAFGMSDDMLPFLRRGSAGLREYNELAKRYGVINDDGVRSAMQMRQAQTELALSVEGLGYSIGEKLSPVLSPLLTQLADWIASHRTDISDAIGKIADQFNKWVQGGGIQKLVTGISDLAGRIDKTVEYFGGWKLAAEALGIALTLKVLGPIGLIAAQLAFLGGVRLPIWLATMLGVSGTAAVAAVASTVVLHGDTMVDTKKPFLGEGAYDSPYTDDKNPNKAKPVGQAISDWVHKQFGNSDSNVLNQWAGQRHALGITDEKYVNFHDSVVAKEGSRYDQMGGSSNRFAGKYQMGAEEIKETAASLGVDNPTQKQFLADPGMQDRFFDAYTMGHYNQLSRQSPEFRKQSVDQQLQTLAYAHNQGVGGAETWLKTGVSGKDAFGTTGKSYADDLAKRQGSAPVAPLPGPYSQPPAAPAGTPGTAGAGGLGGAPGTAGAGGPSGPPSTAGTGGTVNVVITHANAPPGTTTKTTTSGNVTATPAKVASTALLEPH